MEFYGMTQRYAEKFVDLMYNFPYTDSRISGPFGAMLLLEQMGLPFPDYEVLVPTKVREDIDRQCLSPSIKTSTEGIGYEFYDPSCKQFMFRNGGNTNQMKYDLDKPMFETMSFKTANGAVTNAAGGGPTWSRDFVIIED